MPLGLDNQNCPFDFFKAKHCVYPLHIQTPAEVRYLDPQNIPEIPPHELFGCLGFLMRSVLCLEFVFLRKSCRVSVVNR